MHLRRVVYTYVRTGGNLPFAARHYGVHIRTEIVDSGPRNLSKEAVCLLLTVWLGLTPTNRNEYTGMFKGYNLIYLTAEGFSTYAVREDLTPTLYKMLNSSFIFNNYYSQIRMSQVAVVIGEVVVVISPAVHVLGGKEAGKGVRHVIGGAFLHTSEVHEQEPDTSPNAWAINYEKLSELSQANKETKWLSGYITGRPPPNPQSYVIV